MEDAAIQNRLDELVRETQNLKRVLEERGKGKRGHDGGEVRRGGRDGRSRGGGKHKGGGGGGSAPPAKRSRGDSRRRADDADGGQGGDDGEGRFKWVSGEDDAKSIVRPSGVSFFSVRFGSVRFGSVRFGSRAPPSPPRPRHPAIDRRASLRRRRG